MSSLNWYLHRLRAMDAAEIFGRVRDRVRHQTGWFALPALADLAIGPASADVPKLPEKREAPEALKQMLAVDAANLQAGKWSLYGWNEVEVSSPPDWHRDYVRGVSVLAETGKLNHRVLPGGADTRNIWEINRWAEPVRLAMHGWLNDDARALQQAQGWLADWVQHNPVGQGINWSSALEGGLRLINFCWFDAIVSKMGRGSLELVKTQRELAEQIIPAHTLWVKRNLSIGSSANNHRLGELTGLLLAVKRWPDLEKLTGPAEGMWEQIEACVLAQFSEDGGNREQALHYHLFAFEMAWQACRAMGIKEGAVIERLQRAADFFVRMSHPQEPWDYGDSDDAQLVPVTVRRENTVAEWSAWMSGTEARAGALGYWIGDSPVRNPESEIRSEDWWIAPESGMAVIEQEKWKVRVDASPLGFGKLAAHGHCDALHISVWDGENALLVDPGTGGYFGSTDLRGELASWNAHNGPQPAAGFSTPRRLGMFLWAKAHANPALESSDSGVRCLLVHENCTIERNVAVRGDRIVITDRNESGQPICLTWTLAPECELELPPADPNNVSVLIVRNGFKWSLNFSQANEAPPLVHRKMVAVSRRFGMKSESTALEVTGSSGHLVTILARIRK